MIFKRVNINRDMFSPKVDVPLIVPLITEHVTWFK